MDVLIIVHLAGSGWHQKVCVVGNRIKLWRQNEPTRFSFSMKQPHPFIHPFIIHAMLSCHVIIHPTTKQKHNVLWLRDGAPWWVPLFKSFYRVCRLQRTTNVDRWFGLPNWLRKCYGESLLYHRDVAIEVGPIVGFDTCADFRDSEIESISNDTSRLLLFHILILQNGYYYKNFKGDSLSFFSIWLFSHIFWIEFFFKCL